MVAGWRERLGVKNRLKIPGEPLELLGTWVLYCLTAARSWTKGACPGVHRAGFGDSGGRGDSSVPKRCGRLKKTNSVAEGVLVHPAPRQRRFVCAMEDVVSMGTTNCPTSKQQVKETRLPRWGSRQLRLRVRAQRGEQYVHVVRSVGNRVEVGRRVVRKLVDEDAT